MRMRALLMRERDAKTVAAVGLPAEGTQPRRLPLLVDQGGVLVELSQDESRSFGDAGKESLQSKISEA